MISKISERQSGNANFVTTFAIIGHMRAGGFFTEWIAASTPQNAVNLARLQYASDPAVQRFSYSGVRVCLPK